MRVVDAFVLRRHIKRRPIFPEVTHFGIAGGIAPAGGAYNAPQTP